MAKLSTYFTLFLKINIFWLVSAISKSTFEPQCSVSEEDISKAVEIVKNVEMHNAVIADFDNFKFLVGIEIEGIYQGVGAIISDCVIVTAAHVVFGETAKDIIVSIGSPDLMGGLKMEISEIKVYPKYKHEEDIFEFDLALLK